MERCRAADEYRNACGGHHPGYRVGPAEIENTLVKHEAVAVAAVIPVPDETKGALIKAFILLAPGHSPSDALEESIRAHVKRALAPYQQPRFIEFVDSIPMTTTGKVQRKVLRDREAAKPKPRTTTATKGTT